jgi:hypothetical protein
VKEKGVAKKIRMKLFTNDTMRTSSEAISDDVVHQLEQHVSVRLCTPTCHRRCTRVKKCQDNEPDSEYEREKLLKELVGVKRAKKLVQYLDQDFLMIVKLRREADKIIEKYLCGKWRRCRRVTLTLEENLKS